ncbi:MAG: methyltransferase domain-containing protein, partial [Deltaproteobacteria bacterium]|nr:methyltransferase domain-containing protein [Deltaproteobacteria bacterium]
PATAPIDASVDIELDEEPEAVPIARTFRRTTTMALSDEDLEDLEELLDGETTEHTGAPSPLAALVPSLRRGMRAPTPEPEALDESDLDAVQSPSDASDSGEILTEDLIEEVDAQAAPAVARKPAPEPEPEPSVVVAPEPASAPAPVPTPASPTTQAAVSNPAVAPPPAPAAPATKPPPAPKKAAVARAAAVAAASSPEAQTSSKKKRAKPWFEDLFDEDYLRTLPFLTPQATQAEARFVIDALALEPGAQVLDLGCGYGRHAMELAARGFHVVGLDSSLPLLLRGGDESQRRGLTINFVHGDMRELDFDAQFDGAYCLFSTFGFFDDETNKKTAANLARALKPGAKAVIEILNRDYLIGDLPTRVWWEGDGCVVLEEVEFNYFSSRIHSNRSVVFDDGRQLEQEISIRAYSLHELGKLLHSVGFRVLEVSGSIHTRGRFFGSHSRQILVVAERRAPSSKDPSEITRG